MTVYSAVVTTGIYCRPGCGAKPRAENVRTFTTAAAAEVAGFRACLRCRPYRSMGSLPWESPELVCRAVQLIVAGALDDGDEQDLGERLGLSGRHLRRLFQEHLGLTPDQFARSRRAHFARRLLDDTDLPVVDVAFAAGFGSLRQFNRIMREIFRETPTRLRDRRRKADRLVTDGGLTLRLPVTGPYDWPATLAYLGERVIPGVEQVDGPIYRRVIVLDGEPGLIEVLPGEELLLRAHLPYWEGMIHVVERVRRLLALDGAAPPGVWGPFETGVHCVIRRHAGLPGTRRRLGTLAALAGTPVPGLPAPLSRTFPGPDAVAEADLEALDLPPVAIDEVRVFARTIASGEVLLDAGTTADELKPLGPVAEPLAARLGHR